MSIFHFKSQEIEDQFNALVRATTGSEPCYDPDLGDRYIHESVTDLYVENWTGKHTVSADEAAEMCIDCPLMIQCGAYAMAAKEPFGIWGGTRPIDRGIKPKYKG